MSITCCLETFEHISSGKLKTVPISFFKGIDLDYFDGILSCGDSQVYICDFRQDKDIVHFELGEDVADAIEFNNLLWLQYLLAQGHDLDHIDIEYIMTECPQFINLRLKYELNQIDDYTFLMEMDATSEQHMTFLHKMSLHVLDEYMRHIMAVCDDNIPSHMNLVLQEICTRMTGLDLFKLALEINNWNDDKQEFSSSSLTNICNKIIHNFYKYLEPMDLSSFKVDFC